MVISLVTSITTCLLIVLSSIFKPSITIKKIKLNLYWIIALLGAVTILATLTLSIEEWWSGLTSSSGINPLQILILFLSMSIISIYLDELGFFAHTANWVLKRTKEKQIHVFIAFYLLVAALTMFTSNDIVILTLTPFIIFFCKNAKISPIPYLVSEFICANTWSMMFIIGNPTNIYLATSYNISFVDYFLKMAVPTLATGVVEFVILFLIFRKKLKEPIIKNDISLPKENIPLTIIGLSVLLICTVFLIISSYINIPMYLVSAISLGVLVIAVLMYSLIKKEVPIELGRSFKRGPYELIPFIIGMFTLVLALSKYQVTNNIANFFGINVPVITYGYSSMLMANLVNNIPMSVLYSSIITCADTNIQLKAIYASIVGSNIGAFITPLGALAGIMWMNILKKHEIKFSYLDFLKYGLIVGLPSLTITLLFLMLFV